MIEQGFSIPGTVSSEFGKKELHSWRSGFYSRLLAHAERAAATVAAASPAAAVEAATQGINNGTPEEGGGAAREAAAAVKVDIEDGYPKIVAFAGKRQVTYWCCQQTVPGTVATCQSSYGHIENMAYMLRCTCSELLQYTSTLKGGK